MKTYVGMSAGLVILASCYSGDERSSYSVSQDSALVRGESQAPSERGENPPDTAPGCLPLEHSSVAASGVLTSDIRFGPPGYGETPERDAQITIYLLNLAEPQVICPGPDGGIIKVDRVQLKGTLSPTMLRPHVGRRITVQGTLSRKVWGTDYTDVILHANTFRIMESSSPRAVRQSLRPTAGQQWEYS